MLQFLADAADNQDSWPTVVGSLGSLIVMAVIFWIAFKYDK